MTIAIRIPIIRTNTTIVKNAPKSTRLHHPKEDLI
jgi:hypothetical protein